MKKILLFIAILMGLSSVPLLAQEANMSRYITLTVVDGQPIRLNFRAEENNTPVKIVSGGNIQNITVNNTWFSDNAPDYTVASNGTTMTIYGNVSEFSCAYNQTNVTGLDVSNNPQLKFLNCFNNQITSLDLSQNTQLTHVNCESNRLESLDLSNNLQLTTLHCYNNRFTTLAMNKLYCSLPVRPSDTTGIIYALNTENDETYSQVVSATSDNARTKNWIVKYYNNGNTPQANVESNGTYNCPPTPTMRKFITLNVVNGQPITIDLKAVADNTPIRIVSGSQVRDIFVGTNWYDGGDPKTYYVTSGATSMTIYGDVTHLDLSNNGENVRGIDASNNADLKELYGANNKISAINLIGCNKLTLLNLANNAIETINLSTNVQLEYLFINNNNLEELNINNNSQLKQLRCHNNSLLSLNLELPHLQYVDCSNNSLEVLTFGNIVSPITNLNCSNNSIEELSLNNLAQLEILNCSINSLTSLSINNNTQLKQLLCNNNNIKSLDLSNNSQLNELIASNNKLTAINLRNLDKLRVLDISNNSIPSLNISNNSDIEVIRYYGNTFNTEALNILYCALPNRTETFAGQLSIATAAGDANIATVLASNAANARAKNWEVKYKNADETVVDIPTTGSFACGDPIFDESKYITLTVLNNKNINLNFKAAKANTPVKIISGSKTKDLVVGSSWSTGIIKASSDGTTMTIYGDIIGLKSDGNTDNLTAVDFSHSSELTHLELVNNSISSINVNNLEELQELNIGFNNLTNLDVSNNTKLTNLSVNKNRIASLNLFNNKELKYLACQENNLSVLDLSENTKLNKLYCYKNPFTTGSINELYCSLPKVKGQNGVCYTLNNRNDENHAQVVAATSDNARSKNWQVKYFFGNSDIQSEGAFACFNPNMNRFITLNVSKNTQIKMNFKAAAEKTDIRIVGGTNTQDIKVGTNWYNTNPNSNFTFTSADTLINIYGDITEFDCSNNISNVKNVDVSNNQQLSVLKVENNQLATLDITYNTQLTTLNATNNKLTKLDVSNNTQLSELSCDHNLLNKFNVRNNTQLVTLKCNDNKISELDVENNTHLQYLNCSNNLLTSLEVNSNNQLVELNCAQNHINTLSLSNNFQLVKLTCNDNMLTALNLSTNSQLKELVCYNNLFSTKVINELYCSLPIRTATEKGNVYTVNTSSSQNNATVVAATSDNARGKNWNVKYYNNGTNQSDIPSNGNYSCTTPSPNTAKFIKLEVSNKKAININFKAASENTLVRIVCGNTTENLTVGTDWFAPNYKLTSDSKNMVIYGDITEFSCASNNKNLKDIDISNNDGLIFINCSNNSLTSLDISKNTRLETVYCNSNQLTSLELSNNSHLSKIICYDNPFTTDVVNNIYCSLPLGNSDSTSVIYTLNDSTDANFETVVAATSQNAVNKLWKVKYFNAEKDIPSNGAYKCPNTPDLNNRKYIRLSVVSKQPFKLSFKAATANTPVQITSGKTTKDIIVGTDWYTGGQKDGFVFNATDTSIVIYGDITGFNCNDNKKMLLAVDLSNNIHLNELYCSGNKLSIIDVRRSTKLTTLDCSRNIIEKLDVSNNTLLQNLNCSYNNLQNIDLSKNKQLKQLNLSRTNLISLDINSNTLLEKLYCDSNNIVNLSVKNNPQLKELTCASNQISTLDLSNNSQLKKLLCGANQIPSLDLSKNTVLEEADFSKNLIQFIDLTANLELRKLNCSGNQLTLFEIMQNKKLTDLDCSDNQILNLNVSKNVSLQNLKCSENTINYLDLSKNVMLLSLECNYNYLTHLNLTTNIRLKNVSCYGNPFTTEAVNDLYCSLPTVNGTAGKIYTLNTKKDDNHAIIAAATSKNARDKNWDVKYASISADIPSKGSYQCDNAPADMTKIITLSVASGKDIMLDFKAAKANTTVRIVSGSSSQNIIVGTNWYDGNPKSKFIVNTDVTTLTIYGNVTALNCSNNASNLTAVNSQGNINLEYLDCSNNALTALDLSKNTKMKEVHCYDNPFSTDAVNKLYCALPTMKANSVCYILNKDSDKNHESIVAATSDNARKKKWDVKYLSNKNNIPSNGKFNCDGSNPAPNTSKSITLTVKNQAEIKLNFRATSEETPIRIISGSNTKDITVGTTLIDPENNGNFKVKAVGSTMTIYGDIVEFHCQDNEANLTGINASKNADLLILSVANNQITSLDVTKNVNLTDLHCNNNKLTALELSANTKLKNLHCYNNDFNTEAVNELYCSLPTMESDSGKCYILNDDRDTNHETIVAATSDNARNKKWKVLYKATDADVKSNGNYNCNSGIDEGMFSGISVFPNPARGNVMISLDANINETLILVDLNGRAILTTDVVAGKANFDVSNLTSGVYFIRVGDRVQKLTVK